jgi:MFS family permease
MVSSVDIDIEATAKYGPARPVKGIMPTARQSWADLFRWQQRTATTNALGEVDWQWGSPIPLKNPVSLLLQLNMRQWTFYMVGLLAWTADAFDFHALSVQTVKFSKYYDVSKTSVTTAITLTLLLRSVGAALFGLAGDKYGRKWPMVINMLVLGCLQIGTIYSSTFGQFLAARALFGLFMGGVYGNATSMAMENVPIDVRGLLSGFLQQGYSIGYVLAACCNLGVGGEPSSWKIVFWVGAAMSFAAGVLRACFPESKQFLDDRTNVAGQARSTLSSFWKDTRSMLGSEWRIVVYW